MSLSQSSSQFSEPTTGPEPRVRTTSTGARLELVGSQVGPAAAGPLAGKSQNVDIPIHLCVVDESEQPLVTFAMKLSRRIRKGPRAELRGRDSSGQLAISLLVSSPTSPVNLQFKWNGFGNALPSSSLPVVDLLTAFKPPHRLLLLDGDQKQISAPVAIPPREVPPVDDELAELVRDLEHLQRVTRVYFPLPEEVTSRDIRQLKRGIRLLNGERVLGRWLELTVGFRPSSEKSISEMAAQEFAMVVPGEEAVEFAGRRVSLGQGFRHLLSAGIAAWEPPESDGDEGQLTLRPGSSDEYEAWLGTAAVEEGDVLPGISAEFTELNERLMALNSEALQRLAS